MLFFAMFCYVLLCFCYVLLCFPINPFWGAPKGVRVPEVILPRIYSTDHAFAVLDLSDGSVVTWGYGTDGGDTKT